MLLSFILYRVTTARLSGVSYVDGVLFSGITSSQRGGALFITNGDAFVQRCIFESCSVTGGSSCAGALIACNNTVMSYLCFMNCYARELVPFTDESNNTKAQVITVYKCPGSDKPAYCQSGYFSNGDLQFRSGNSSYSYCSQWHTSFGFRVDHSDIKYIQASTHTARVCDLINFYAGNNTLKYCNIIENKMEYYLLYVGLTGSLDAYYVHFLNNSVEGQYDGIWSQEGSTHETLWYCTFDVPSSKFKQSTLNECKQNCAQIIDISMIDGRQCYGTVDFTALEVSRILYIIILHLLVCE